MAQHRLSRALFFSALSLVAISLTACEEKGTPSPEKAASLTKQEKAPSEQTEAGARSTAASSEREEADGGKQVARAKEALLPLKKGLMSALKAAMGQGGPAAAIDACRLEAPQITAQAAGPKSQVGRSALLLRNPKNKAPAWVSPLLDELSKEAEPQGQSRTSALPDGGFGYVESIVTQPVCVTCHGESIGAPLKALLDEHYPDDEALGFALGSFRGVFWVELSD